MRALPFIIAAAVVAGCAVEAPTRPEAAAVYAPTEKPEAKTLEEARRLGYKVVNENGQAMYCRETRKTGSHIQKDRTCLTQQELMAAREISQRNFDAVKRNNRIPQGLEGGRGQ